MARPAARYPTELELQFLKILWLSGQSSVQDVRAALAERFGRELARTTVVTTLNTMTDKGLVSREQQGKAYLFAAAVTEDQVSRGMLGDLLERVFDGSAQALLLNLLESEQVSDEEHRQLRKIINRRRGESA